MQLSQAKKITYAEVPRFPTVNRDLAMVLDRTVPYHLVEKAVTNAKAANLKSMQLFDIFESEKLGLNKKSMAISFTFTNQEKTLTDKEIDGSMNRLIRSLENEVQAEIRK